MHWFLSFPCFTYAYHINKWYKFVWEQVDMWAYRWYRIVDCNIVLVCMCVYFCYESEREIFIGSFNVELNMYLLLENSNCEKTGILTWYDGNVLSPWHIKEKWWKNEPIRVIIYYADTLRAINVASHKYFYCQQKEPGR